MKIIEPYAKLMSPPRYPADVRHNALFLPEDGIDLLRHIEWSARISHRSEDAVTDESWKKIIQHVVLDHSDWSVVEHATVSVDACVDRGITHEWVRHRLASYTQESTRFVSYVKKMPPSFIYPRPEVRCEHCLGGDQPQVQGDGSYFKHAIGSVTQSCAYDDFWLYAIDQTETAYADLIHKGWRPQEARSVFPNALASRIITTANLRNWRHFLIMRTSQETHPQMKQVTIPLLAEFKAKIPLLFDDIEPNMKQSVAMAKVR